MKRNECYLNDLRKGDSFRFPKGGRIYNIKSYMSVWCIYEDGNGVEWSKPIDTIVEPVRRRSRL